ncbi:acetyltransferase [Caballeronia sp. Sq4a]|uniref:acetyltransferase n=1 Tax=Caballeronia sp. Sq4a TaxID=2878152 RepID=UPI0020BD92B6|nr:acetyltransferase [Caballeronia sp. Sq4a]
MRKRLLIIGGGGLGRIVYDVLSKDASLRDEIELGGFLDTRADVAIPEGLDCAVVGNPLDYKVREGDLFIPAVGDPVWRRKLVAPLQAQGAAFFSFKNGASVAARVRIGEGTFVTPGAVISTDCAIGAFTYIDTYTIVGHDVTVGEHCMIGAMTFIAGGVNIGDGVTINPRSTIAKGVTIGAGATIGIGSVVVRDVPPGVTVFGNPARTI